MEVLSNAAASAWCEAHAVPVSSLEYTSISSKSKLAIDGLPAARVIALTNYILPVGWIDEPQHGCLIWLRQSWIWGDHNEQLGEEMWNKLVASDAAAAYFPASEARHAQAAMLLPIMFGWDAFVVPQGAGWALAINHDGWAAVRAFEDNVQDKIETRLSHFRS